VRHWVIGNGLSLRHTPLELLKNEVTWAMNRIHLHYENTTWRPTYFFMCDWNQQNPHNYWRECIDAHADTPKYLWDGFRDGHKYFPALEPIGDVPNTTWISRCERHHYYMGDNYRKRAESWHLPEICTAFSGIGAVMQLAVLNGATEICLLGCDLYVADYSQNFVVPNYAQDPRDRSEIDNANMTQVHKVAKRSSPVPIFNCTFGGMLDVHPRKDFYEVVGEKETYRTGEK
jgi:hypothetical protein